jgi:hypothetical protein
VTSTGALRVREAHRAAETHLALLLAAEGAPADRGEHVARPVAEPLLEEVGGGGARRAVVDADVRPARAEGQVGHQGDDGNAGLDQSSDGCRDLRHVGGLEDHALRAALGDLVEYADQFAGRAALTEVEA